MCPTDNPGKPSFKSYLRRILSVLNLPAGDGLLQNVNERRRLVVFLGVQIQMQHRIFLPLLLKTLYLKSFKQILLSPKICLQCAYQQALAETPRTVQEIIVPPRRQIVNHGRLVDIAVALTPEFFEILYSYRVFFHISASFQSIFASSQYSASPSFFKNSNYFRKLLDCHGKIDPALQLYSSESLLILQPVNPPD